MIRSTPRRRWRRRASKRCRMLSTSGKHLLAHIVHDPVAEALHEAHHQLRLAQQSPLLGGHEPDQGALGRGRAPADHELADATGLDLARIGQEATDLALQPLAEVGPEPGMRLQLEGVRRLVQGDPGPEVGRAGYPANGPWPGCSPRRTAVAPAPPPRTAARCRTDRAPGYPGSPAGTPPGGWPGIGWHASRHWPPARCCGDRTGSLPRGDRPDHGRRSRWHVPIPRGRRPRDAPRHLASPHPGAAPARARCVPWHAHTRAPSGQARRLSASPAPTGADVPR